MPNLIDLGSPLHLASDDQLIASLVARRPLAERRTALKELIGRRVKRAAPILRRIARSATAAPELRMTAAIALGQEPGAENRRALEAALGAKDDEVARRTAEALGRIGDRKSLEALRTSPVPGAPAAARAHGFARALISYRLGLGTDLVLAQGAPARLDPKRATTLPIAPIGRVNLAQAKARLPRELPELPVHLEGGVELKCNGVDLLVVPHAAPAKAMRGNFVPAVVFRRAHSLGHFTVHLYILAHPIRPGAWALHGARPDGTIAYKGEAHGDLKQLRFTLDALDVPLAPPFFMEGALDPKTAVLDVTAARTARTASKQNLTPARAVPGPGVATS